MASTRTGTSWLGEEVGAGVQAERSPWARMWDAEVLELTQGEGLPRAGADQTLSPGQGRVGYRGTVVEGDQ